MKKNKKLIEKCRNEIREEKETKDFYYLQFENLINDLIPNKKRREDVLSSLKFMKRYGYNGFFLIREIRNRKETSIWEMAKKLCPNKKDITNAELNYRCLNSVLRRMIREGIITINKENGVLGTRIFVDKFGKLLFSRNGSFIF